MKKNYLCRLIYIIMNKIIIFLLFLGTFHLGLAQQPKLLIEFGGAFDRAKSETYSQSNTAQIHELKSPKIQPQIGFGVSSRSYIGLSYNLTKQKEIYTFDSNHEVYTTAAQRENLEKTHAFGIFYRYYFMPFNKTRWNTFAEVNPSYQLYNVNDATMLVVEFHESFSGSTTAQESSARHKAIDMDIRVGASYRIAPNFHAQLSVRSLANVKYTFNNSSKLFDEQNETSYRFFTSPLSNTYLSLLFSI